MKKNKNNKNNKTRVNSHCARASQDGDDEDPGHVGQLQRLDGGALGRGVAGAAAALRLPPLLLQPAGL